MALKSTGRQTTLGPIGVSARGELQNLQRTLSGSLATLRQSFSEIGDAAFDVAASERKRKAEAAAMLAPVRDEEGNLIAPEVPEAGLSIYNNTYRQTILTRYKSQAELDAYDFALRKRNEMKLEPGRYLEAMEQYRKTTLETVLPEIRSDLDFTIQRYTAQHHGAIDAARREFDNEETLRVTGENLRLQANTAANAINMASARPETVLISPDFTSSLKKSYQDIANLRASNIIDDGKVTAMLRGIDNRLIQTELKFHIDSVQPEWSDAQREMIEKGVIPDGEEAETMLDMKTQAELAFVEQIRSGDLEVTRYIPDENAPNGVRAEKVRIGDIYSPEEIDGLVERQKEIVKTRSSLKRTTSNIVTKLADRYIVAELARFAMNTPFTDIDYQRKANELGDRLYDFARDVDDINRIDTFSSNTEAQMAQSDRLRKQLGQIDDSVWLMLQALDPKTDLSMAPQAEYEREFGSKPLDIAISEMQNRLQLANGFLSRMGEEDELVHQLGQFVAERSKIESQYNQENAGRFAAAQEAADAGNTKPLAEYIRDRDLAIGARVANPSLKLSTKGADLMDSYVLPRVHQVPMSKDFWVTPSDPTHAAFQERALEAINDHGIAPTSLLNHMRFLSNADFDANRQAFEEGIYLYDAMTRSPMLEGRLGEASQLGSKIDAAWSYLHRNRDSLDSQIVQDNFKSLMAGKPIVDSFSEIPKEARSELWDKVSSKLSDLNASPEVVRIVTGEIAPDLWQIYGTADPDDADYDVMVKKAIGRLESRGWMPSASGWAPSRGNSQNDGKEMFVQNPPEKYYDPLYMPLFMENVQREIDALDDGEKVEIAGSKVRSFGGALDEADPLAQTETFDEVRQPKAKGYLRVVESNGRPLGWHVYVRRDSLLQPITDESGRIKLFGAGDHYEKWKQTNLDLSVYAARIARDERRESERSRRKRAQEIEDSRRAAAASVSRQARENREQ